jgi:plasmid maintenance system antidote protein VapI
MEIAWNRGRLKGMHPGKFIEGELRRRKLPMSRFAITVKEYPQTLNAILKGRRGMNTALSLRIEKELSLEEGFLMMLQVFYDIRQEKRKEKNVKKMDLSKFRPGIFWDTDFDKIDWKNHYRSVIEKVFSIGNDAEKKETTRFYGEALIKRVLDEQKSSLKHMMKSKISRHA